MKEFPAYQAPALAFFSGDFYRHVAKRWGGIGLIYLFMLSFCAIAISDIGLYRLVDGYVDLILNKVPPLHIKDNKVLLDVPSPYEIMITGEGGKAVKIVFDTSGKMKTLKDSGGALVLVTADSIIMKDSLEDENATTFSSLAGGKNLDLTVTKETIGQWRSAASSVILSSMGVLAALALLGHFLLALIYGGLGCIMASITEAELGYGACVRLACVAMTPGIIISVLLGLTGLLQFCVLWAMITVPVTLGYLYFGCASAAKPETPGL